MFQFMRLDTVYAGRISQGNRGQIQTGLPISRSAVADELHGDGWSAQCSIT